MVSRAEHLLHWQGQERDTARLQSEIDTVTRRLDEITPASEVLKTLAEREHELEVRIYGEHH